MSDAFYKIYHLILLLHSSSSLQFWHLFFFFWGGGTPDPDPGTQIRASKGLKKNNELQPFGHGWFFGEFFQGDPPVEHHFFLKKEKNRNPNLEKSLLWGDFLCKL